MRFIRHTFDVDAELVGNESADIIRGKDFSRSRCLLTPFQAGNGHDKAPRIGKAPAVDHEIRSAIWLGSGLLAYLLLFMRLRNRKADKAPNGRYVTSAPHCRAMWIRVTESRSADGTNQAAGC